MDMVWVGGANMMPEKNWISGNPPTTPFEPMQGTPTPEAPPLPTPGFKGRGIRVGEGRKGKCFTHL